tara:strand:+ start:1492 stop:1791 length:300 start_codon:yes stop_codon:yes gene_type:complete
MVRSEIISELSKKIGQKLNKPELEKIFQLILNAIIEGIKENRATELRSFGRFSVKNLKENRNAKNPKTGEKIILRNRKSISFKMAKDLKKKINQNGELH